MMEKYRHLPFWLPGFVKLTVLLLQVLIVLTEINILLLLCVLYPFDSTL